MSDIDEAVAEIRATCDEAKIRERINHLGDALFHLRSARGYLEQILKGAGELCDEPIAEAEAALALYGEALVWCRYEPYR